MMLTLIPTFKSRSGQPEDPCHLSAFYQYTLDVRALEESRNATLDVVRYKYIVGNTRSTSMLIIACLFLIQDELHF
jgi:hypothetical protein